MAQYSSQQVVFGRAFALAVVAALKTAPANPLINLAKLRLSQSPVFNPTPLNVPADFIANEATYSGYTAGGVAVVLTVGLVLSQGAVGAFFGNLFLATGAAVQNLVYGYWIDDGTNVIVAERFAGGVNFPFQQNGDNLDLNVFIPVQLTQNTK